MEDIAVESDKLIVGGKLWGSLGNGCGIWDDLTGQFFPFTSEGPFVIRHEFIPDGNMLRWRQCVTLAPGEESRSVTAFMTLPYPEDTADMQLWLPDLLGERNFAELDRKPVSERQAYCDFWAGIHSVAMYKVDSNCGLFAAKAFELSTGILRYRFTEEGFEVRNTCRYLTAQRSVVTELLLCPSPGCWRPGLGRLYERYKTYFASPDTACRTRPGGFMIANPFTTDAVQLEAQEYHVAYTELHNHFPAYGQYVPECSAWPSVIARDYPGIPAPASPVTPELLNELITRLHQHKIKVLFYLQLTGDLAEEVANRDFPDAKVIFQETGSTVPVWRNCILADGSANTSFGQSLAKQLERLWQRHPDIDGVFVDQLCYEAEDMAHDDGETGLNNQPGSILSHSYLERLKSVADFLHAKGKLVFGNGPRTVEVQKEVDVIMAEGTTGSAAVMRYYTIDKPLLIHEYPTETRTENIFRTCLATGSWLYSFGGSSSWPDPGRLPAVSANVFKKCIPLVNTLAGRKWCFEPNPLTLPEKILGDIFYAADGCSWLITAADATGTLAAAFPGILKLKIHLTPPGKYRVEYRSTCHDDWQPLAAELPEIELPEHALMSVVKISFNHKLRN